MKSKILIAALVTLVAFGFTSKNGKADFIEKTNRTLPVLSTLPLQTEDSVVLESVQFSETDLKAQWGLFSKDRGWAALLVEAEKKGFKRIEKSSWGFSGKLRNKSTGKTEDVMFCAFDFYSPSAVKQKSFQTCSMVWRKMGKDLYKAYIVFPKGENKMDPSFDMAEEWYADEKGSVQKAKSFNKCFRKCIRGGKHSVSVETIFGSIKVTADCKSQCLSGIAVCGGVTAILELASGGLGTPVLIATFGICAGVACGQCFAMCALGCS